VLSSKVPVSIIIIAQNEEKNIGSCVQSLVGFFDDIWVIDSFSEDNTAAIAEGLGAKVLSHQFTHWAAQRNWALENASLKYDWILFLDADEQVTPGFCQELATKVANAPAALGAMNVRFEFYFLHRPLRHAYESPPVLRVIQRGRATWEGEGAREYARVLGEVITLQSSLIHRDQKGLASWTTKHIKNALREAESVEVLASSGETAAGNLTISREREGRRIVRKKIWNRLPRLVRPFLYFGYRYFIRGGWMDGKAGFAYCFLHGLWFPLLIDLLIEENSHETNNPKL
jgi:glycosyltransferase involved in cell wall biosynthesis